MPFPLRRTIKSLFNLREKQTHVSSEPPKIQELQFFPSKISLNGTRNLMSDSNQTASPSDDTSKTPEASPLTGDPSTPSRAQQVNGGLRTPSRSPLPDGNQSNALETPEANDKPTRLHLNDFRSVSQPAFQAEAPSSPHHLSSQPGTPTSETGGIPWSAAVGRASLGKSGRVIDRLMGDNDRLRRDKTLATVKLEEELKKGESARSTIDTLEASNANLQSLHDIDKSALTRKDRKLEEMKIELDAERSRREKAEAEIKITRREHEEAVEKYRKEAMKEQEEARYASTQYDVLSKSWKGNEQTYQRQIQKLRADIVSLQDSITRDQKKLQHLELITDQLRQEGDKSEKAKEDISNKFEAYKREQSRSLQGIKERADRNELTNAEILKEMEVVLGQMRYVVNIKKDVKEAE